MMGDKDFLSQSIHKTPKKHNRNTWQIINRYLGACCNRTNCIIEESENRDPFRFGSVGALLVYSTTARAKGNGTLSKWRTA